VSDLGDIEQTYVAMPKLKGAPAYYTPPRTYAPTPRPADPDDLPLEAFMTDEERAAAQDLRRGGAARRPDADQPLLRPRGGTLRSLAARLLKSA